MAYPARQRVGSTVACQHVVQCVAVRVHDDNAAFAIAIDNAVSARPVFAGLNEIGVITLTAIERVVAFATDQQVITLLKEKLLPGRYF